MKLEDIALLPEGNGWLLVEFGADTPEAAVVQARALMEELQRGSEPPYMRLIADPMMQARIWSIRELGTSATQMSETAGEPDAIVTNGYSCREQIEQCAGRKAVHLAEVIQMAIHHRNSSRPRFHHAERAEGPAEVW